MTKATEAAAAVLDERAQALLDEAAKDYPEAWLPEKEGDSIAGVFSRLERAQTAFGPAIVAVLIVDGVERSLWLLQETFKSQFGKARPAEGELVAVLYKGKRPAKNPTPGKAAEYHDFRVVVDRGESGGVSWDELGGDSADEPAADAAETSDDLPEGF